MFGQLIKKKSNKYQARWTINLIIWFIAFWSINYRKLQLYIPLFFQNFEKLKFAKRKIQQMTFLVCDDFNLLIHYALDIFFSLWGRGSIAGFQSEIWVYTMFHIPLHHYFYCILINKLSKTAVLFPSIFAKISKTPSFHFIAFLLTFHQKLWSFIDIGLRYRGTVNLEFYYITFNKNWQYWKF